MPDLAIATFIRNGYINRVFVYIKTDKCDRLLHNLPPWLWLCAAEIYFLQYNPRCKDGRSFSNFPRFLTTIMSDRKEGSFDA
jgi:hypothetical protein